MVAFHMGNIFNPVSKMNEDCKLQVGLVNYWDFPTLILLYLFKHHGRKGLSVYKGS